MRRSPSKTRVWSPFIQLITIMLPYHCILLVKSGWEVHNPNVLGQENTKKKTEKTLGYVMDVGHRLINKVL